MQRLVSLSQDVKLRQTIKLKTKKNINLLSSIGKGANDIRTSTSRK